MFRQQKGGKVLLLGKCIIQGRSDWSTTLLCNIFGPNHLDAHVFQFFNTLSSVPEQIYDPFNCVILAVLLSCKLWSKLLLIGDVW